MKEREKAITDYFNSWVQKDISVLAKTFSSDAVYIESWGPAYRSIEQIHSWFEDWNRENTVLEWRVQEFYHIKNICICEWYFECECGGNVDGFDGVSIITFNEESKIISLKEFQSKTPNIYPYE